MNRFWGILIVLILVAAAIVFIGASLARDTAYGQMTQDQNVPHNSVEGK